MGLRGKHSTAENARMSIARRTVLVAMLLWGAWPAGQAQGGGTTKAAAERARLDLNRASVEDLLKLPGMTHTWAARIVRFRPYREKNDLLDRGILPDAVYDRIKDCVVVHREKAGS